MRSAVALVHADFLAVTEGMKISATIPVEVHGEPAGVKAGGIVEQLIRDLDISCSPKDLPEKIDANIEHLEVGDSITIGDLDIPEGVEPTLAADVLVAIVNESRVTKSADEEAEEEAEVLKLLLKRPQPSKLYRFNHFKTSGALWLGRFSLALV